MKVLKYPVIPFTLFVAAGIFTGYHCLWPLSILLGLLCILLLTTTAAFFYAKKQLLPKPFFEISTVLLAFSLGLLAQWLSYAPNQSDYYTKQFSLNENPIIKGTITERLKPNAFSEKYLFEITSVNKHPASGTILVTLPKDSTNTKLHTGDVLFIGNGLKPITPALNPYQFDYAAYMAKQNVFKQVKLKDNYIVTGRERGFGYHLQNFRESLINSYSIHHYPAEVTNLINALLFGQRQDMDKETTDSYTGAGVIHILAISGLHFSLLFLMLNYLLSPLKRLPRFGTIGHLIVVLSLMWGFAFITGLSASVVRSVVMFSFLLIGEALSRRVSIYNSLAVSALVLLIAKPGFLFDAGFQLSYLAVLGIVALQPLYKNKLKSKHRLVNMARDLVLVSLSAQVAVLPLSLYYFNQFPLLFLVANIVVIPLSNAVLVVGIVTLLLNFTIPAAAVWLGKLLEWLIIGMNGFTQWIASFENLIIKNIPFTLLLNLSLYMVIVLGVLYFYEKSYKRVVAALAGILVFQGIYMFTAYNMDAKDEMIVFHNYRHTIIAHKTADTVIVSSTDSLALQNYSVLAYAKGSFNTHTQLKPMTNLFWQKGKKVYVMDSSAVYNRKLQPDVLVLTQSPRVNLDRLIDSIRPKQVVADATNYKTYTARWAATCHKKKIPFHATAEKGGFLIE